ncbi:MAG TPA: N-6 DNA methylase [Planktothrix sp.]|jgi:hypothetical protein
MVSPVAAKRGAESFKQLRLLVGNEILRNRLDILRSKADMHCDYYVAELLDEYAIRLLIEWLVCRSGSPVYAPDGKTDEQPSLQEIVLLFENLRLYPFLNTSWNDVSSELRSESKRWLDASFEPQPELIGALYEHVVNLPLTVCGGKTIDLLPDIQSDDKRRLVGQFYTPPHIVHRCYQSVADADLNYFMSSFQAWTKAAMGERMTQPGQESSRSMRLLDPSCGTGNFLIGAIRFLAQHTADKRNLSAFAQDALFGIELDGRAAMMARIAVLIELLQQAPLTINQCASISSSLSEHVIQGDTVLLTMAAEAKLDATAPWTLQPSSFDLVITNPPYVSFGSRNQPELSNTQASILRRAFPEGAEYKIRLHSIFQDIALRYCRAGGRAVLLVPDGFLTGSFYGRLRKLILSEASIAGLSELADDTIPGAVVGRWCVADYRKKSQSLPVSHMVRLYSECEYDEPIVYHAHMRSVVSPQKNRFRLVFDARDEGIIKSLDPMKRLNSRLRGHTGMRSKSGQKEIVSDKRQGSTWRRGIKSGAQVLPYRTVLDRTWLNVDATLLFSGGFDEDVVGNPKVLMRQTGDRLIAAVDLDGLFHLNNVHSFSSAKLPADPERVEVDLHFIVGVVNSNLWLYLYQNSTRERSRPLAQIDIETVEGMPIPDPAPEAEQSISILCHAIAELDAGEELNLLRVVDRLVYDLYKLDESSIEHVEEYCRRTNAKKNANYSALPSSEVAAQVVARTRSCIVCGEPACRRHFDLLASIR